MKYPMVGVVVTEYRERIRTSARLLGRLTRHEGRALAAEVAVVVNAAHPSERYAKPLPATRYTLVPIEDVEALDDEARALMADVGKKPGLAAA